MTLPFALWPAMRCLLVSAFPQTLDPIALRHPLLEGRYSTLQGLCAV